MRKNWLLWLVIAVVLIAIAFWVFSPYKNEKAAVKEAVTTESATSAAMACENEKLKEQLATALASLEQANKTILILVENCGGKKTTTYTRPAAPAPTPAKKATTSPIVGGSKTTKKTVEPEADYDVNVTSVPKSKVTIDINEQKFCVRLGDQFWPHLAVNQGKEFPEIVDNGIGGFDLFILPSGSIGSTGKNYGITEDGVMWIAVSELSDWAQFTPYILISKGFFVKAERSGNYWIAK